jgi:RimJ/RimL family protein N-acetyltransferase
MAGFSFRGATPHPMERREKTMMRLPERFRTPRLLLTRIGPNDLQDMLGMHREAQVAGGLGGIRPQGEIVAHVESLASEWDRQGYGWWAVRDPESGRFIGRGGLRPVTIDGAGEVELGYALLPEYWNRGLATELSRVSVAQGFVRLDLADVVGFTLPVNHGSRRVLEKTGLRFERSITHAGAQHALYRLTAASWRVGLPAAPARDRRQEELVAG